MRVLTGILKAVLWLAVLGGLGVGVYLLLFRDEDAQPRYRYVSALGPEGETRGCVFSDRRPSVRILERKEGGFGTQRHTRITAGGRAALALADACDDAEPELRMSSVAIMLPGAVPVRTTRLEKRAERERAGRGEGKQGAGRGEGKQRAGRGEGKR